MEDSYPSPDFSLSDYNVLYCIRLGKVNSSEWSKGVNCMLCRFAQLRITGKPTINDHLELANMAEITDTKVSNLM